MSHQTCWTTPSNIAIVKYWGKYGTQLPRNPNISFTLDRAHTRTGMNWQEAPALHVKYYYDGQPMPQFSGRVEKFLKSLSKEEMPWLQKLSLDIDSKNSFPHSSGIASSASFMASMAMCLCTIEQELGEAKGDFLKRCSHIARLGSGSAARSVYPVIGQWGKCEDLPESSQEYAIPVDGVHEVYHSYHNDILIVNSEEKSVSSSAGHELMNGHVMEQARYAQAEKNITETLRALKEGDVSALGEILEIEALTLHGLMMNSASSYILMKPMTLQLIEAIRDFRQESKVPVYFSLDAGPNIHMLYPAAYRDQVLAWRKEAIDPHCERVLEDCVGAGPKEESL